MQKIVYSSQKVFPLSSPGENQKHTYTLPSGSHEFDFSFKLPSSTQCDTENHESQPLPPTLPPRMYDMGQIKVQVRYELIATIIKQSKFGLSKKKSFRREIVVIAVESLNPKYDGSEIRGRTETRLHIPNSPFETFPFRGDIYLRPGNFHSYTEPIAMQIEIYRPAITPGTQYRIALESIQMAIHTNLYVAAKGKSMVYTKEPSKQFFCKKNLDSTIFELDDKKEVVTLDESIWWDEALCPDLTPSFLVCNLGIDYALEVTLEIKVGTELQKFTMSVQSFNISSGVPALVGSDGSASIGLDLNKVPSYASVLR